MWCKACRRTARVGGLCRYHADARDALKKGYDAWRRAYSEMDWKDYLQRVKALEETGRWVKEVIVLEETGITVD